MTEHDNFSCIVFDLKIVSGTGQIEGAGGKGSKKN
jgi:hypothetical protein